MQALREVVTAKGRDCSIRLPEWAVGQELEVIILPSSRQTKMKTEPRGVSLIEHLLAHPLKVGGFSPMSRESIYER
jgi:hypothetical protein